MNDPPVLPFRSVRLDTSDPDALAEVQPERKRRYRWISQRNFRGTVIEEGVVGAAIGRERWSCGMRVSCDRPRGYKVYCVPLSSSGRAIWCGQTLAAGDLLRVDEPWEISTSGAFEYIAFAVDATELAVVAAQLAGGEHAAPAAGNLVLHRGHTEFLAKRLHDLFAVLRDAESSPAASRLARSELLRLAASLDGAFATESVQRLSPPSRRRSAVRRIEEYIEANRGDLPTIPQLCEIASVSERTLEYAFREQIGMTPVRYLKVQRMNGVRRDLRAPQKGSDRVDEVALRWGFRDLGRFAGEYRSLFGELPSQTLRKRRPIGRGMAVAPGSPPTPG